MQVARRSTPERGGIKQRILYLNTGPRRQICKTQFLHYFKISRFVVESVAKAKAADPPLPGRPLLGGFGGSGVSRAD
jgi:hypothetical protein